MVDTARQRWDLLWAAEISSRYHRRRAAWLNNCDFVLNIVQMLSASAAVIDLTRDVPGPIAQLGAATVAVCALVQVIGRLGKAATDHELTMKSWCDMLTDIELHVAASPEKIAEWIKIKGSLNKSHVGELRALAVASENEAATALGVSGRQRSIEWPQWWLMHFFTYQRIFPEAPDVYLDPPAGPGS